MRIKSKPAIFYALLASLLLHFSMVSGLSWFDTKATNPPKGQVEIEIIELNKVSGSKAESDLAKQIVEQDKKQLNEETPDNARFLGRHNQRVVRETKAAAAGKFNNSAGGGKQGQLDGTSHKKVKSNPHLSSLQSLAPTFRPQVPKGDSTEAGVHQDDVSRSSDYLKEVETGVQTLLSTREFVYYTYYQRIREKIRQQWEPKIRGKVEKIFAQGRSIASARDRITKVLIILNNSGSLINVKVIGQSGIHDLDDAAVEAFRAAEPFPNPPDGMVEQDGTIKIRWDFILEARLKPSDEVKSVAYEEEVIDDEA